MRNSSSDMAKSQNTNFSDDEEDNFDEDESDEEIEHDESFASNKKSKPKSKSSKKELVDSNNLDLNLPRYNFNAQMYQPHQDLTSVQNNNESSPLIASFMTSQNSVYAANHQYAMFATSTNNTDMPQAQSYSNYTNYQVSQQPSQFSHQGYNFMSNPSHYQSSSDYTAYQNQSYQAQFMPPSTTTYTPTSVNSNFLPVSTCVKQIITSSPLSSINNDLNSPSSTNLMANVTSSSSSSSSTTNALSQF